MNEELEIVNPESEDSHPPVVDATLTVVENTAGPLIENPVLEAVPQVESTTNAETVESNLDEHEADTAEELPEFSHMGKADLVRTAKKAAEEREAGEALIILKSIRPYLEQIYTEEKAEALAKYLEEGGEKDGFEYRSDESREQFNQLFNDVKQRKDEARKRQEAEKLENLHKKEALLDEIKKLNDNEETAHSLKKLKELQSEWKTIKNVPKEHVERLWESYHVLVEMFYDRLSINNELKDLDRSKNLDHKIELIAKVNELEKEPNIKKAFIAVRKYQEEWRNIGPVAREASEDIWNRFRSEVEKVYALIKAKTEEIEQERRTNLEAKKALLEKAKAVASFQTVRIKDWTEKSNEVNQLMEEWKKIGQVPMAVRDQVWNEFRDARNTFYHNKNQYFKVMHAERNANLKAKEELCVKAEAIAANPIDWVKQTNELKLMQEAWKKIGMAPEKVNDAVWRRFRTACDGFFSKKSERYASQIEEQSKNLEAKQSLITRLEELSKVEEHDNIFQELKQIQTEWNAIGFVPAKQKDSVSKSYNDLLDKLYAKHKQLSREMRDDRERHNLELLAGSSNGLHKLQREEKILMERIRGLRKDIETWDNNLGFFKSGNSKNPLAEQIHAKIEITQKHVAGLEEKLKMLKALRNKPIAGVPS